VGIETRDGAKAAFMARPPVGLCPRPNREDCMVELEEIARTIARLAAPGMTPKDLLSAVRRHYPDATKKQVSRAAFMAVILTSDADPDHAAQVQALALTSRAGEEEPQAGAQAAAKGKRGAGTASRRRR
jgi:hypothetical protein